MSSNKLIALSKYLGKAKSGANLFHFSGVYKGQQIERLEVQGGLFHKGKDYMLSLSPNYIDNETLNTTLLRSKEVWPPKKK